MKKIFALLILTSNILCFPAFIYAETILLKSGKVVDGKIIEKTNKYLRIDFEGIPLVYFFDEIESINGEKPNFPSLDNKTDFKAGQEKYFFDKTGAFKIIPPEGFDKIVEVKNGVAFIDEKDGAAFQILLLSPEDHIVEDMNNKEFRGSFIKKAENSETPYPKKFINCREREINGFPAWEFVFKAEKESKIIVTQLIYLRNNNKEFQLNLGVVEENYAGLNEIMENALATFQIL
jgi:hypothetical protein